MGMFSSPAEYMESERRRLAELKRPITVDEIPARCTLILSNVSSLFAFAGLDGVDSSRLSAIRMLAEQISAAVDAESARTAA